MATERSSLLGTQPGFPRVLAIEGLRPILSLWIVLMHYPRSGDTHLKSPDAPRAESWVLNADRNGYTAVEIFLVISGFVVGISPKAPPRGARERLGWFLSRVARLALTYYVTELATLYVILTVNSPSACRTMDGVGPRYLLPVVLLMAQSWCPFRYPGATWTYCRQDEYVPFLLNGPCWYVSTLVGCYALYTLVGDAVVPRGKGAVGRCAWLALALGLTRSGISYFPESGIGRALTLPAPLSLLGFCRHVPLCTATGFFAGVYTGSLARLLSKDAMLFRSSLWLVVDTALFATICFFVYMTDYSYALTPLFCLFALAACAQKQGVVMRSLMHPSLVALAPSTYAVYCWLTPARALISFTGWDLDRPAVYSSYVVFLFVFAALYERLFDRPARTLLTKFVALLDKPRDDDDDDDMAKKPATGFASVPRSSKRGSTAPVVSNITSV